MGSLNIQFSTLVLFIVFSPVLINAKPPAIFIFGDSTVDVGTNPFLPGSIARANFPYYGIDFIDSRPTGRFSNGFNIADFICKLMGFRKSPQPYLFLISGATCRNQTLIHSSIKYDHQKTYKSLRSGCTKKNIFKKMFRGVNFASAGSGILPTTGQLLIVIPLAEQIYQFATVKVNLADAIGESLASYILSKSVFLISAGNNDIVDYIQNNSTIPMEEFVDSLMTTYEGYIRVLYELGARKFGIISTWTTGCSPSQRILNATGGCLDAMNDLSMTFHSALEALLTQIDLELRDFQYSVGNVYELIISITQDPCRYKLKVVDRACCGAGRLNAEAQCNITTNLCKKRNKYLFWDLDHASHVASRLVASVLYNGELKFVSPINFRQLGE